MKPLPLPTLTAKQIDLFWSHVDRRGPTECWPWKGATTGTKYLYGVWVIGGRSLRPHRVAYALCEGPITEGLTIDHVKALGCTDTLCCNPAHLEPATMTEQIVRRDAGKVVFGEYSICKWGHVRPRGRKAKCPQCNVRFAAEGARRRLERDPEGERAKRNANRQRQRATAKMRQEQPELEFAQ